MVSLVKPTQAATCLDPLPPCCRRLLMDRQVWSYHQYIRLIHYIAVMLLLLYDILSIWCAPQVCYALLFWWWQVRWMAIMHLRINGTDLSLSSALRTQMSQWNSCLNYTWTSARTTPKINTVKRCAWDTFKTDSRYPERLQNGVYFIPIPKPQRDKRKCVMWIRLAAFTWTKMIIYTPQSNKILWSE